MAPQHHKDGGVKKLLMLLAVPEMQELHSNIKSLLRELNFEELDFTIAADIKMGNV